MHTPIPGVKSLLHVEVGLLEELPDEEDGGGGAVAGGIVLGGGGPGDEAGGGVLDLHLVEQHVAVLHRKSINTWTLLVLALQNPDPLFYETDPRIQIKIKWNASTTLL